MCEWAKSPNLLALSSMHNFALSYVCFVRMRLCSSERSEFNEWSCIPNWNKPEMFRWTKKKLTRFGPWRVKILWKKVHNCIWTSRCQLRPNNQTRPYMQFDKQTIWFEWLIAISKKWSIEHIRYVSAHARARQFPDSSHAHHWSRRTLATLRIKFYWEAHRCFINSIK